MRRQLVSLLLALSFVLSLSISCFAVEVRPSVTKKEAPVVETIEVKDVDGKVVEKKPSSTIIITPVSKANDAETSEEISKRLDEAYEELSSIESITDLENGEEIAKEIDKEYGEGTSEDLVVRDVFDVDFSPEYNEVFVDGRTVTVNMGTNLSRRDALVVMMKVDDEWIVIDEDDIIVNTDGSVSVTFHEPLSGPMVFLVDETPLGGGEDIENTDGFLALESTLPTFVLPLVIILIIAVVAYVVYKKRSQARHYR